MKRILIFGAGVAGTDILKEVRANPSLGLKVIGFIDDDPEKQGFQVKRAKILGDRNQIKEIVKKNNIDQVILAIPSAPGEEIASIVKICAEAKVSFLIVPRVKEIIEGKAHISTLRRVKVEDLLGRPVIKSDIKELKSFFQMKNVLVTGAAGSIGSELVRQIIAYKPKKLVLFDCWESGIFNLLEELKISFPEFQVDPVIGNIRDEERVRKVMKDCEPNYVFHAAAYKHVPLMEDNPTEAVKNNVFGTLNVAKCAEKAGVERFVLVSTDKAAEPINIMGMTKLIAETVVKSLDGQTKYITVRFGNVLDSYGSVIPLFRNQIENGGPVTVTDKRMTRFFMTIPEAAQLILKAALLGKGNELFVLDMGEPVRIVDLALNLIRLSGFVPDKDIKIVYSGIRPGEKLKERLFNTREKLTPTKEEKIFITSSAGFEAIKIKEVLDDLKKLVTKNDNLGIRTIFKKIKNNFPA